MSTTKLKAIAAVCPGLDLMRDTEPFLEFRAGTPQTDIDAAWDVFNDWTEPPEQDWQGYGIAIATSTDYLRITAPGGIVNPMKSTLELMIDIHSKGDDRRTQVKALWDAINAQNPATTDEIEALNAIGVAFNIDRVWTISPDGTMRLT